MSTFQKIQRQLTEHIRDPDRYAGPAEVEPRRLTIYRDLFYNNIEGFLSSGFPVLRSVYSDQSWHAMVRDFLRLHICQSPYFLEITEEFLAYLQHERRGRAGDPAFILELAQYEWVELALDVAPDECPEHCPEGDLLAEVPVLSPLAWPLVYQYPVHLIGAAFQPDAPPAEATYLVVYRTPGDKVEFMEINAVTFRLLALIQSEQNLTGAAMLRQIGEEIGHPDPDQLLDFGRDLLQDLRAASVILGTVA